jgi:hypothetical protein
MLWPLEGACVPGGQAMHGDAPFATRTFHRKLKYPLKDVEDAKASLTYLAVKLEKVPSIKTKFTFLVYASLFPSYTLF